MKFRDGEGVEGVSSMMNNVHDSVEGGRYPFDKEKKNLLQDQDSSMRLMGQRSLVESQSLSLQSSTSSIPSLPR